jgi:hypothetical protein
MQWAITARNAGIQSDNSVEAKWTPSTYRQKTTTVEFLNVMVKTKGEIVTHVIHRRSTLRKTFSLASILEPCISKAWAFVFASFAPPRGFYWGIQNRGWQNQCFRVAETFIVNANASCTEVKPFKPFGPSSLLIFQVSLLTFRHPKGLVLKRVLVLPLACRHRDSRDEA